MTMEEIVSKFPTREDLLSRLPSQPSRRRGRDELLAGVGLFGAGVLVGAGLALLFAPKPGREVRRELGERVERARSSGDGETRPAQRAGA